MTLTGEGASAIIMTQYAVYDHPRDYPQHFVLRKWYIMRGNPKPVADRQAQLFSTLEAARTSIPHGMFMLPGQPGDDSKILEVWI